MVNAKRIDGVGVSVAALGEFRHAATRMVLAIRDTTLVVMALLRQCGFRCPRWRRRP